MFKLPNLNYDLNALEPHISAQTMKNHYHFHHQKYIDTLNQFIEKDQAAFHGKSLEDIIKTSQGPVFNNAAQIWNHDLFWQCMSPNKIALDDRDGFKEKIISQFGSFENLSKIFKEEGLKRFGSGWVWLIANKKKELTVVSTANAENPLTDNDCTQTLLACDVWEHAYYLDTQYNRGLYMESFWQVIDWEFVAKKWHQIQ